MKTTKEIPHQLIAKYFSGTLNSLEKKQLQKWVRSSPESKSILAEFRSTWSLYAGKSNLPSEKQKVWDKIEKQITKKQNPLLYFKSFIKIAAAIIISFGVSYSVFYVANKQKLNRMAYLESQIFNEISAPLGSKSKITLPDGSSLWLNGGSKITYPNNFMTDVREVYLEGEAYFDIKKNASIPFIVKTSNINIKVLGTSFNVKSYPEEGTIETTLVSGEISIFHGKSEKELSVLKPNQRATFIKKKGKILLSDLSEVPIELNQKKERIESIVIKSDVKPELYTSWKEYRLIFDNESFEILAVKLERWYGIKMIFKSPNLKNYKFRGKLDKETLEQALQALQFASADIFEYEINKDQVLISERNTNRKHQPMEK